MQAQVGQAQAQAQAILSSPCSLLTCCRSRAARRTAILQVPAAAAGMRSHRQTAALPFKLPARVLVLVRVAVTQQSLLALPTLAAHLSPLHQLRKPKLLLRRPELACKARVA